MPNIMLDGDIVVSTRSGIVENRHIVHAAVVDATGNLLFSLGDPSRVTLVRSAAKPAQAIAAVESGALERFGLDEADLALICGSHSSEDRHIERAKSILTKLDITESDLQCGGHSAFSPEVNREWIKKDFVPTAIYSTCNANHMGVIAAAKAAGESIENYHDLDHPVQTRIKTIMQDLTGIPVADQAWALDGCNVYGPATPLQSIATIYASFAQAAVDVDKSASEDNGPVSSRVQAMARIFKAMVSHPELIGGEGCFETVMMEAWGGALFGKTGAAGTFALGIRESEETGRLGAQGSVGITVKIEDGDFDVLFASVAEILAQLEVGTAEMRRRLEKWHRGEIKNTRGIVTGRLNCQFKLRKA